MTCFQCKFTTFTFILAIIRPAIHVISCFLSLQSRSIHIFGIWYMNTCKYLHYPTHQRPIIQNQSEKTLLSLNKPIEIVYTRSVTVNCLQNTGI